MIGKWSVDRYMALIRRWMYVGGGMVAILTLTSQARWMTIVVEAVILLAIGWIVVQRSGGKTESLAAGAFVGIFLGLASSLCHYIVAPNVANGISIIIETLVTGLAAPLVAVTGTLIATIIHQQKN